MTKNEKKILTLLSKQGPLSKKNLASKGKMGWATAVKMVTRLEESGLIHCIGTDPQGRKSGKTAYIYALNDRTPLIIGIDITYVTTRVILTNLSQDIISQARYRTPESPTFDRLISFLDELLEDFLVKSRLNKKKLQGVGIGMPLWLVKGLRDTFGTSAALLSEKWGMDVRVDNNIYSYALFKKWTGGQFDQNNFVLLTIRNGIGAGIFYHGQLIRGTHGLAGELSHLTLEENGLPCFCGNHGCLETLVNRDVLFRDYRQHVLKQPSPAGTFHSEEEVQMGLIDLFSRAKKGDDASRDILKTAAGHLAKGLITLLMIIDIPTIVMAADFGNDGDIFIPFIQEELQNRIVYNQEYVIQYYRMDPLGFAKGSSLLISKDFLY